ncbi:Uncharacterised protein [Staphylococcus aureus]|nr:Uncharacterised protein [Staphylococcus aureus]
MIAVTSNDIYGTPFLFVLPNASNANLSLLIEYSIRVEAYIPELPADNTDVKMTAFINDAANANPAFLNTNVNGDVAILSLPPINALLS